MIPDANQTLLTEILATLQRIEGYLKPVDLKTGH
jgi:hypothetical protein